MNKENRHMLEDILLASTRGLSCRESSKKYVARVMKSHHIEKLVRQAIESKKQEA